MRRSILLLALTLLANTSLLAQSELQSGTIDDGGISWILTDDYVLTIAGDGVISDYSSASSVPWYNYRTQITTVKLAGYITSIGKYTFYNHTALKSIYCVSTTPATLMSNTFSSSQLTQITAYVPEDAMSLYQSEQYWSQMTIAVNPDLTTGGTSEAYLSGIYLDGVVLDGFDPMIFSYQVSLPSGTTNYPNVTYTLNDESLQVTVDQPSSDNPQATLTVTTSDGSLTNTYAVAFTIENSGTTTLTGYGILINSDRVVTTEEAGTDTNGRQQYLAHAQLNAYDTIRIIDLTNNNATWMVELDAASVSGFEGSASLGYLVCTVAGCYDCYIKLKYEDDQLYIGAGTDGCSEGVYYPINNGTGTTTTAAYYLIGNAEELGAWSLADAKPLSQTNDTTIILAAGLYSFKVLPQNTSWDGAMGFSALNTGCTDNIATDVDDNIVITLAEEGSVYVQCDGQMICVSGSFAPTSSTVHFTATVAPEEAGYVSYTDQDFPRGTTIELTASISTGGWMFDRWSDNDSWDNPRSIYLDKDTTITAIFSPGEYGIQVNGSEVIEGTYTGRVSDGSYIGQFLVTTNLQAGDQIQIINLFHGDNSTWRPELEDGGVSGNFTVGDSELICNTAGCYSIYIKIAYGQSSDYVYIANGDGCSNGEYVYSLVGSAALFGNEWDVSDSTTEMTLQAEAGNYTYLIDSVSLAADTTYEYKVISNHAWNVREYPSLSDNYQLTVEQAGVYSIIFILDPNTGCTATTNYLHALIQGCEVVQGTCGAQGDNLTWSLSCDSVLTISGSGAMADYSGSSDVPWHDYAAQITSIVLDNGVTTIGAHAFHGLEGLIQITLPDSLQTISNNAFEGCRKLRSISIPSTVTDINN
ncbi:MAG: leucine-rich repeat protein, partial [Paludibacteraceae bacterium]|nr:leucine-rich repeat protein [Paludibacteraceae bacterium]